MKVKKKCNFSRKSIFNKIFADVSNCSGSKAIKKKALPLNFRSYFLLFIMLAYFSSDGCMFVWCMCLFICLPYHLDIRIYKRMFGMNILTIFITFYLYRITFGFIKKERCDCECEIGWKLCDFVNYDCVLSHFFSFSNK